MSDREYLKKYLKPDLLEQGLKRLENGEPVQYIIGNVDFYGYKFEIDKRVLIPRFETEELIEKTINYLKSFPDNVKIIDLGTGSGCIAITLKKLLPQASITAVDISEQALEVARVNASNLKADITFIKSDMLDGVDGTFDVIISNPPYIAYDEEIMKIVKNNEPKQALYAANDGLYYYEQILKNCPKYLQNKFLIAFEIGQTQGEKIKSLAYKYLDNITVDIVKDIQGLDRFIFIKNN